MKIIRGFNLLLVLTFSVFLSFLGGCKKFDRYDTEIFPNEWYNALQVEADDEIIWLMSDLEAKDLPVDPSEIFEDILGSSAISDNNRSFLNNHVVVIDVAAAKEIYNLVVDWTSGDVLDSQIDPETGIVFIAVSKNVWVETGVQILKASRVYHWNLNSGEFYIDQADRTEQKSKPIQLDSECEGLIGSYKLVKMNNNQVPWKEFDDGFNSFWWSSGSITFNSDGSWSSSINSRQIIGGSSDNVRTVSSGDFTCSSGQVEMVRFDGAASGQGTFNGSTLTLKAGKYTNYYEKK